MELTANYHIEKASNYAQLAETAKNLRALHKLYLRYKRLSKVHLQAANRCLKEQESRQKEFLSIPKIDRLTLATEREGNREFFKLYGYSLSEYERSMGIAS